MPYYIIVSTLACTIYIVPSTSTSRASYFFIITNLLIKIAPVTPKPEIFLHIEILRFLFLRPQYIHRLFPFLYIHILFQTLKVLLQNTPKGKKYRSNSWRFCFEQSIILQALLAYNHRERDPVVRVDPDCKDLLPHISLANKRQTLPTTSVLEIYFSYNLSVYSVLRINIIIFICQAFFNIYKTHCRHNANVNFMM